MGQRWLDRRCDGARVSGGPTAGATGGCDGWRLDGGARGSGGSTGGCDDGTWGCDGGTRGGGPSQGGGALGGHARGCGSPSRRSGRRWSGQQRWVALASATAVGVRWSVQRRVGRGGGRRRIMGVVVKKSPPVMVRPFEPPPTRVAEKLSSFDKSCIKSLVTSFLVFEHPIPDTAETIKRALSQALVYYNPFAGRIAVARDGEIHVWCHSEGAAFVAASADCTLKDATLLDLSNGKRAAALLNELAVVHYREAEGCLPTDPLLLMQVTEFSCGGFVLGVTWNHGIADGVGLAQFLQSVGELARGSPSPSVVPVRGDASLPSLLPESTMQIDVWIPEPLHFVCLDVSIPSSLINRIKASFRDRSGGQPCTTFETVAAVLWQCRTRAIVSDPGSIALLSFAINVRKHVGAKDGYYGNCITMQDVTATSAAVVNADIVDLVKMIKLAKDEFELFSNNDGFCKVLQETDEQQRDQLQYNTLLLSSWRNIGFEEADFGGGTPAKVMGYMPPLRMFPVCVVGLPCKWKDGPSNVFSVCVKEEHAEAFVAELARLNA